MTFIKSSMYYSIEKVIRLFISLFIASMLAKTLGLSKFGEFSLYISFTTLISFVASFSLDYVSMSEYAKKENIHKKVTNIFFLRILTSVIYLFFITILFFVFFKKGFYEVITLSLMYFFSSSIVIENYYLSLAKGKLISKFRLISFFISSVAKVYIIFNIENNVILYLCFAQIIDSVFLFVVFCFTFKNEFKLSYFDYKYCKYVIKKSLPLILSSALIVIYNRVDQLMINYYLGSESLGLYSIGVRLSDAVNVVIMSVVTSYIPLILEYKNKNEKKFNIEYDKLLKLVLMLLTFGVVVFEFCGEQFLNLAFGKDYVPAFSATLILFISLIFSTMGTTSSHLLISDNLEKYRLYRSVFSLAINVVLNVILIPYIGIVGAAIATLISQLYSGLLGYLFNKKLRYILLLNLKVFIFWNLNVRKVSVYIATHNRIELLKRALNSVRKQTYSNIEIIICDDGSRDGTWEYLKSCNDSNLIILRNSEPLGACVSRNRCINAATGRLITGLDDDDYFYLKRIERFIEKYNLYKEKNFSFYMVI